MCGAYAKSDYERIGCPVSKMYKWGYFPEHKNYDIDLLIEQKKSNSILWAGRFIDWKHPDYLIYLADYLKKEGFDFHIKMIGEGPLKSSMVKLINDLDLSDCVEIIDKTDPESLRKLMEISEYYLITSDRNEGWGAVVNEAMNSGCLIISSNEIGASSYLINNNVNGFLYDGSNFESFKECFLKAINYSDKKRIAISSYFTIDKLWNDGVAAKRLYSLAKSIVNGESIEFKDGPCSKA